MAVVTDINYFRNVSDDYVTLSDIGEPVKVWPNRNVDLFATEDFDEVKNSSSLRTEIRLGRLLTYSIYGPIYNPTQAIALIDDSTQTVDPTTEQLGDAVIIEISQNSSGFSLGQPIYKDGSSWKLARGDSQSTISMGLVYDIVNSNSFRVIQAGKISLTTAQWSLVTEDGSSLTAGQWYILSQTSAGKITKIDVGDGVRQFVLKALSSTDAMVYTYIAQEI